MDAAALNATYFDPDVYLKRVLKETRLAELTSRQRDMMAEVANLDCDMQVGTAGVAGARVRGALWWVGQGGGGAGLKAHRWPSSTCLPRCCACYRFGGFMVPHDYCSLLACDMFGCLPPDHSSSHAVGEAPRFSVLLSSLLPSRPLSLDTLRCPRLLPFLFSSVTCCLHIHAVCFQNAGCPLLL